jgi:hypothetical protein
VERLLDSMGRFPEMITNEELEAPEKRHLFVRAVIDTSLRFDAWRGAVDSAKRPHCEPLAHRARWKGEVTFAPWSLSAVTASVGRLRDYQGICSREDAKSRSSEGGEVVSLFSLRGFAPSREIFGRNVAGDRKDRQECLFHFRMRRDPKAALTPGRRRISTARSGGGRFPERCGR